MAEAVSAEDSPNQVTEMASSQAVAAAKVAEVNDAPVLDASESTNQVTEMGASTPDPTAEAGTSAVTSFTITFEDGVYKEDDGTAIVPTETVAELLPAPVEPVTETVTLTVNPDGSYNANNGTVVLATATVEEVFTELFPTTVAP